MDVVVRPQRDHEIPCEHQEQRERQHIDQTPHGQRFMVYSAAGSGGAIGRREARAPAPTRQRRSLRLTTPPNAMITQPIQIQGTSGFQ